MCRPNPRYQHDVTDNCVIIAFQNMCSIIQPCLPPTCCFGWCYFYYCVSSQSLSVCQLCACAAQHGLAGVGRGRLDQQQTQSGAAPDLCVVCTHG